MTSVAETALETMAPALRPVAEAARAEVLRAAPHVREEIKWGNLCFTGRKSFVALVPHKEHVNLQFWEGTALDPEGELLEGTGKSLRHFKLRSPQDARRPDVVALVRKAAALDQAKVEA